MAPGALPVLTEAARELAAEVHRIVGSPAGRPVRAGKWPVTVVP
ncbi:MAG TPA: hypothetical protein VK935_01420 [Actinomycetospora sp.]|nr:hypothetical protein [Actinomycetospora sp.]